MLESTLNASDESGTGTRKKRERTCAACRKTADPGESDPFIRWVLGEGGTAVPDLRGRSFGRGAYLHRRPECLKHVGASLSRSFKTQVTISDGEALSLLSQAATASVWQLLGAARREGKLAAGATIVEECFRAGQAHLLLVAQDARAAAEISCVSEGLGQGIVRVFGSKEQLGKLVGRPEVGVIAIQEKRLAIALIDAIALALLAPRPDGVPDLRGPGIIDSVEVE